MHWWTNDFLLEVNICEDDNARLVVENAGKFPCIDWECISYQIFIVSGWVRVLETVCQTNHVREIISERSSQRDHVREIMSERVCWREHVRENASERTWQRVCLWVCHRACQRVCPRESVGDCQRVHANECDRLHVSFIVCEWVAFQ